MADSRTQGMRVVDRARARRLPCTSLFMVLLLLSGCATVSLNAGFTDVSAQLQERNVPRIVWNSGTDLDDEAATTVKSLLTGKLSADQAVQIALLNNRRLQATYSDLGVAQADLVQAGLLKNPIFHTSVLFQKGGSPDIELGADFNFLEVFYLPLRKRVAAARFEEAKLLVTGAVLDFAAQVRTAFYAHEANLQMLELRQTIMRALDASFEIARRLSVAGNMTDLDLARERAQFETSKLALRSAELAARSSREQLNSLMGIWGADTEWDTEGRLPEIPSEPLQMRDIERVAVSRSLNLLQARQRVLAAGEQLGLSRSTNWLPELDIGVHGEREEGSWQIGPDIAFPIPLFDQGQARIGRAAAELRRAHNDYYALAVEIRAAARSLRGRLEAAREQALYYRDILLPLRERIVNEAQLQYNAMQLGPFQLLQAREQQVQAAIMYIDALREYWLARGDAGQLMSGGLPRSPAGRTTAMQRQANGSEGH